MSQNNGVSAGCSGAGGRRELESEGSTSRILRNIPEWPASILLAMLVTLSLVMVSVEHIIFRAGLYADGANYFLHILNSGSFFHVSPYRVGSTLLTQIAPVAAISLGTRSISILSGLHSADLIVVPVLCYISTTWIVRRDGVGVLANMLVVTCCFFTTVFDIIGEYHVLYATFWLSSVLVLCSPKTNVVSICTLIFAGIVMLRSYELSVVTGGLLFLACLARSVRVEEAAWRFVWVGLAILFLAGVPLGLEGILFPRDATNAGAFSAALRTMPENETLLSLVSIVFLSYLTVLPRDAKVSLLIACLVGGVSWVFAEHALNRPIITDLFGLGYQNAQRAQVFPVLVGSFFLLWTSRWKFLSNLSKRGRWQWCMAIPLILVTVVYHSEVSRWSVFLHRFCHQLRTVSYNSLADLKFLESGRVSEFAWNWELPTLSVLLRPANSSRIIRDKSYTGWMPFDPNGKVPDIERFKKSSSICRGR